MTTRAKYLAATDFSVAGHHFPVGDDVVDPVVLDAVLRFGDRFVSTETRRARRAAEADAIPAEDQPPTITTEESP